MDCFYFLNSPFQNRNIYLHISIFALCVYLSLSLFVCVFVCMCVSVCMSVCIYVCVCVCVCVCIRVTIICFLIYLVFRSRRPILKKLWIHKESGYKYLGEGKNYDGHFLHILSAFVHKSEDGFDISLSLTPWTGKFRHFPIHLRLRYMTLLYLVNCSHLFRTSYTNGLPLLLTCESPWVWFLEKGSPWSQGQTNNHPDSQTCVHTHTHTHDANIDRWR